MEGPRNKCTGKTLTNWSEGKALLELKQESQLLPALVLQLATNMEIKNLSLFF